MSEKKEPRKLRYTDSEMSVIKNTFSDNHEEITRTLRKCFLQLPLDVLEQGLLDQYRKSQQVLHILRKSFLPTVDVESPLFQVVDLWMTIDIKDKTLEQAEITIMAREKLIDYLDAQLKFIETNKQVGSVFFSELTSIKGAKTITAKKEVLANLVMRNTLLSHIEQQIQQLILLAGNKEESTEETLKRLAKNSTK